MKGEVMELVVTACEKHSANNEVSFLLYLILNAICHCVTPRPSFNTITTLYARRNCPMLWVVNNSASCSGETN
jgi:hypothetical protein